MSSRPEIRIQEIFPFCFRDGIDVKPIVGNILFGRDSRTLQTVLSRPNLTTDGYESPEPMNEFQYLSSPFIPILCGSF